MVIIDLDVGRIEGDLPRRADRVRAICATGDDTVTEAPSPSA
jgi:hypothetical protein